MFGCGHLHRILARTGMGCPLFSEGTSSRCGFTHARSPAFGTHVYQRSLQLGKALSSRFTPAFVILSRL